MKSRLVSYQNRRSSRRATDKLVESPWAPRGGGNRPDYPRNQSNQVLPVRPWGAPTGPAADRGRPQRPPHLPPYPPREFQPVQSTSRLNPRNLEDALPNSSHSANPTANPPIVIAVSAQPRPIARGPAPRQTDTGWGGRNRSRNDSGRGGYAAAQRRDSIGQSKGKEANHTAGRQDPGAHNPTFPRNNPPHRPIPFAPPSSTNRIAGIPAPPADAFTVYVTGAPADMTEDELRVVFNDCGTMSVCSLLY